jgi:hypothetical protein
MKYLQQLGFLMHEQVGDYALKVKKYKIINTELYPLAIKFMKQEKKTFKKTLNHFLEEQSYDFQSGFLCTL